MDDLTVFCLFGLLLLAIVLYSRRRQGQRRARQETYDDPDVRSGGSIGGSPGRPGQRSHDDPSTRSGGSFGGRESRPGRRSHDDPEMGSSGSFGGNRSGAVEPGPSGDGPGGRERPRHDDPDTRSGGSFGG